MHKLLKFLPVVAFAYAFQAQAQQYDGVWTGIAGQWAVKLTVTGTKGRLGLTCGGSNDFSADIPVAADGSINSYVTTGQGRRQITGKLPDFNIPPGGSCGGGKAALVKK